MAKTRAQKTELLNKYKELVDRGNFVIVKTNRIPANSVVNLRKNIAKNGAKFYVIKNRVFLKAVENHKVLGKLEYTGQLAVLDGGDDLISALKALDELKTDAKTRHALAGMDEDLLKSYIPFEFYAGYMDDNLLEVSEIERLKSLPDKQTLLGMLVGTIAAPLTGLMNTMNGNTRKLVYVLNDLQQKKQ